MVKSQFLDWHVKDYPWSNIPVKYLSVQPLNCITCL
uniref:Uncharacterized protein n=1 Tax=Arundo donax TaxID=35708 RepID=A0A0A9BMC2_ARUDO